MDTNWVPCSSPNALQSQTGYKSTHHHTVVINPLKGNPTNDMCLVSCRPKILSLFDQRNLVYARLESFEGVVAELLFLPCRLAPAIAVVVILSHTAVVAVPAAAAVSPALLLAAPSKLPLKVVFPA